MWRGCRAAWRGCAPLRRGFTAPAAFPAPKPWVTPGWERPVGTWLAATAGGLVGMIMIGGYTRMTGSGLSMTDWRPQGRSLPSTAEEWDEEFARYKSFPEYQRMYSTGMAMERFQEIYFIEWAHRMWGRALGLGFIVPAALFAARGVLRRPLIARVGGLFALGGCQAVVGWWMVRSGLEQPEEHFEYSNNKRTRVSPYRIAFHWAMALALYGGVFWCALSVLRPAPHAVHVVKSQVAAAAGLRGTAFVTAALLGTTLVSGAYVAGNEAGLAFNTWPKMLDHWVPPEVVRAYAGALNAGGWRRFFEDTAVVQFDHRILAYSTYGQTLFLAYACRNAAGLARVVQLSSYLLVGAASAQVVLGISTLLWFVPLELGMAHQVTAIGVWSAMLATLHALRLPGPA